MLDICHCDGLDITAAEVFFLTDPSIRVHQVWLDLQKGVL